MSYRDELEMCVKSGQMTAAEYQAHVAAGETSPTDAQIDKALYAIDGVMNHADPGVAEMNFPFMPEHLAKMREIIKALYARPPL